MTVLFWIVAVVLILVLTVALFNSTATKNVGDRYVDILVGVVAFACLMMLVKNFGGVL